MAIYIRSLLFNMLHIGLLQLYICHIKHTHVTIKYMIIQNGKYFVYQGYLLPLSSIYLGHCVGEKFVSTV